MFFRLIYDDTLAQAAYLIGCQRTGEAIVIDPERDIDRYLRAAAAERLTITAVAETHIHADFLSGSRELAERTGAKVYVSGEGGPDWQYGWLGKREGHGGGAYNHQLLRDGDSFRVGNIEFKALHTPGHTPEHMCYTVTDRGGGAKEPMGILTGDCVFVGDVGRPDLLETAAGVKGTTEDAAKALHRSIQKLRDLPEYLQVWPAHGAGSACGKALGAVPQSTVGYEKRLNPALLAAASQQQFLDYILEGQPEPPLYFGRMKRQNRDGPPLLAEIDRIKELGAEELAALAPDRPVVLDLRPWALYRVGHLPGALHTPWGPNFLPVAGSYVTDDTAELCLVAEPEQLDHAIRALIRIGLDRITSFTASRDLAAFKQAGGRLDTTPEIDVATLHDHITKGDAFVLDVRRAPEFASGRIEGATNIAHTRLAAKLEELPRNKPIFVHCQGGMRSAFAAALLRRKGFDASNVAGGFGAWVRAGYEIVDSDNP